MENPLENFFGPKYTKEGYESLDEKTKKISKKVNEANKEEMIADSEMSFIGGLGSNYKYFEINRAREEKRDEMRKALLKLEGKAHAEAKKLNDEYEYLLDNAQKALEKVQLFEKEKLDMSEENLKEKYNKIQENITKKEEEL